MYLYKAYGLGVHSTFLLPEFEAEREGGLDLFIRLGSRDMVPTDVPEDRSYVRVSREEVVISIQQVGIFIVNEGRQITVIPVPGVDNRLVRAYITGTMMAAALFQRGVLVLHASAVEIDGLAVAFMGIQGSGKSSIAATLYSRGHRIVTDDNMPMIIRNGTVTVFPSFPQLKLTPEVADFMGYKSHSLIALHDQERKGGLRVADRFVKRPLPLGCVYAMHEDTEQGIEPLGFQNAIIEMVRHSFPTRIAQPGGALHFQHCTNLVKHAPFFRLTRSTNLSSIQDLAHEVEQHTMRNCLRHSACSIENE